MAAEEESAAVWLFGEASNSDAWDMCSAEDTHTLEAAFKAFHVSPPSSQPKEVIEIRNKYGTYEVNLRALTQKNVASNRVRPLQRLGPNPEELIARAQAKAASGHSVDKDAKLGSGSSSSSNQLQQPTDAAGGGGSGTPLPSTTLNSLSADAGIPSAAPPPRPKSGGEKKLVTVPGGISPDQRLYVSMRTIPLADFLASIDKEGMDLDKESDVSGGTLLTWAAEFHRSDICRVLLERNADPLKKSRVEKMNALEWATRTPARGSDGAQERDQVISMLTKSAQ